MTDVNRNILPLHFAVDPGPDFTWWKDEEDERIAAKMEPADTAKLSYMNEYMDLVSFLSKTLIYFLKNCEFRKKKGYCRCGSTCDAAPRGRLRLSGGRACWTGWRRTARRA